MEGGTISSNSSYYGGGVYVHSGGSFQMEGGTISGNTASYGGGVSVSSGGTFTKTNGTITGYASDPVNGNRTTYNLDGHAAYVSSSPTKRRETTAGPSVNMDSRLAGSAGGWE